MVQSGKPVGIFKTHPGAPRVLIANSMLVPAWATWENFRDLEHKGLTMYGQMTAGSWIYIGTQGILQGTFETLASLASRRFGGSLEGRVFVSAGLGGMGGAQPLAATMNGGGGAGHRGGPAPDRAAPADALRGRVHRLARRRARRRSRRGPREKRGRSIALLGNAADVLPELVRRGVVPDVLTDQTSAHDELNGYVPNGMTLAEADGAARRRPRRLHPPLGGGDGRPRRGHARPAAARRGHVRLRQQHPRAGGEGRRGDARSTSRASCPSTSARCSARARGRSAGRRSRATRPTSAPPTRRRSRCSRTTRRCAAGCGMARERVAFQGLPARIFWLGYGERARFGLRINELVRRGVITAPIVIGRDHLDTGSVASPNRETEGMRDGSDAIADWPILNALLNASSGATWVSVHHGGGVGIGYSIHAGMVIVADGIARGRREAAARPDVRPGHGRRAARRRRLPGSHRDRRGAGRADPDARVRAARTPSRRERPAVTTLPTVDQRIKATLSQDAGRIPVVARPLRLGPHQPAAAAARRVRPATTASTSTSSGRRRRPSGSSGADRRLARSSRRRPTPRVAVAARGVRRHARVLRRRPPRGPGTGHVPARRGARVPHVRELPRAAPRAARTARGDRLVAQPLRADVALRHADRARAGQRVAAVRRRADRRRCPTTNSRARSRRASARRAPDGRGRRRRRAAALASLVSRLSRRAGRLRVRDRGRDGGAPRRRRPTRWPRWPRCSTRHARLLVALRVHLRAAAAPRARLRRAEGDPRDPGRSQEPLTLTEISQRLGRTPGSTKDYLSWLEDVDLVSVHQKRYRFRDPLLRMWVRLHCRPTPPTAEEIGREVQLHAAACLTVPAQV